MSVGIEEGQAVPRRASTAPCPHHISAQATKVVALGIRNVEGRSVTAQLQEATTPAHLSRQTGLPPANVGIVLMPSSSGDRPSI